MCWGDSEVSEVEGVIKYTLSHQHEALDACDLSTIKRWFQVCRRLDLIGQDPARYGGAAYGNISRRHERGFLITGTQTGALVSLDDEHISHVMEVSEALNQVRSRGLVKPSSESMTHSALYQHPMINAVIHIHSPPLWRLTLPSTPDRVAYGTPEMARAVARLLLNSEVYEGGVIRMSGHEDGVLFFGADLNEAGERLLNTL